MALSRDAIATINTIDAIDTIATIDTIAAIATIADGAPNLIKNKHIDAENN